MKVLGLDASDGAWSLALLIDGQCQFRQGGEVRDSLGAMCSALDQALAASSLKPSNLDRIACTRGPGGFTGVRVAVGLAQGLALGGKVPIAPVSSLAALAMASPGGRTLAALDARMGELYLAEFEVMEDQSPRAVSNEQLLRPEQVKVGACTVGVGRGFGAWPELAPSLGIKQVLPEARPDAQCVARIGSWMDSSDLVTAETFEPIYLRNRVTG